MEISPSCTATDLETDICFSCGNEESQELPDLKVPKVETVAENRNDKRDECDYLYFKTEEEKEREVQYDSEREEEENGGRVETEEDERRGEVEGQDDGGVDLEGDIQQGRNIVEHRGRVEREDTKKEESKNYNLGNREIEGADEGREDTDKVNIWITGILGEIKRDASSDQIFVNENPQSLLSEPSVITSDPPESTLQEAWRHDLDNRDNLSESHLSDSLKAELAVVYSESDFGEDQWLALARCDETDHSKENRDYADDTCIAQSMKDDEVEEVQTEVLKLEERVVDKQNEKKSKVMENSEELTKSRRDIFLRSPSVNSTASSTDPDRRIPLDFYVQQETFSENVSTEHVDFLVARQQWKKMEEEVKGLSIPKPGLGAKRSFKGTHSSLYPPTRCPRLKHR
ncbi:PREDICTED: myb-like protein X isoform X1 [Poecilia mexicana]|uniref:myb-like protein X isoform X1 n=1 Tax=Poecilia mexicana TaxID=48701 RepID=UPI00072E1075|nr:PREDICTED: myb-like protein X isoform X1 [Poecilia mexicana]